MFVSSNVWDFNSCEEFFLIFVGDTPLALQYENGYNRECGSVDNQTTNAQFRRKIQKEKKIYLGEIIFSNDFYLSMHL